MADKKKKVEKSPLFDQQEQIEKIEREVTENEALKKGPFAVYIKHPSGKIDEIHRKTLWRLIFALGIELEEYTGEEFKKGIVFKIVRGTAGSD